MDLATVHDAHMAINLAHRFVYFVPEAAEEYASLGIEGRGGYFGVRAAPMGPVPEGVVLATFYNFSPAAVTAAAIDKVWATASPADLQAARFRVVDRAMKRAGVAISDADLTEARSILDPIVAGLDLAGKPLAAANAGVALPADALTALWQQITVVREWRGDVHIALLIANGIGPCDCMVLQAATGRFPLPLAKGSRQWSETEWADAIARLSVRGWADASGALTPEGHAAREGLEADTDRLCAPIWECVGAEATARLATLLAPIDAAMQAAGTYAALR